MDFHECLDLCKQGLIWRFDHGALLLPLAIVVKLWRVEAVDISDYPQALALVLKYVLDDLAIVL